MLVNNKQFLSLPRKRDRVFRGTSYKNNDSFSPKEFLIKLKHYLSHNLSDVSNVGRVSLLTMNKYKLEQSSSTPR